ncbi:hypothetical protein RhiirC2_778336 [Rhizophagus irregularis]|uniref:Uncharacterized protein n=1 Tax=Rhizophagus irregularis TaxID=588596 RepID=A0A2N1NC61_9GLOM|nr:hypothetical protein RhiirC2_778336 [Rhizophagus irregularis]
MSEVFVKIDNEIDTEKIDVIDNDVIDKDKIGVIDKDNYHNEDRSIVGWSIDNKNEGQLKFEFSVNDVELDVNDRSQQLCISDDKKLAYIRYKYRLELYDMMNDSQKITLEFVVGDDDCDDWNNVVDTLKYIMSINYIQNKNNKLMCKCKKMYWLPRETRQVSISKKDKNIWC